MIGREKNYRMLQTSASVSSFTCSIHYGCWGLGLRDRRNFSKKMLKLSQIKERGKKVTDNPHRSPKLYTFDEEAYADAKKTGMRLEF